MSDISVRELERRPALRLPIGIHPNVPEADYHADPAPEVSASSGALRKLYDASARHAWSDHPRLNPAWQPRPSTEAQDAGTILHALTLNTPAPYTVLHFDDFRKKDAQVAREDAKRAGSIPILAHKFDTIAQTAAAVQRTLRHDHPDIYTALTDAETQHETSLIWREAGVMCRCRFDALPPAKFRFTVDLKFTGLSAEPESWSVKLRRDYLFQAAFYPRAVKALRGDRPEFRFVVCETDPPYGISVHATAPDLEEIANRRVDAALRRWAECLRNNDWPSYSTMVHYANAPGWFLSQDDDRAMREQIAAE